MTQSGNTRRKMKSASRLYAVQALFQMEQSGQTVEAVVSEFEDFRFGAEYVVVGDATDASGVQFSDNNAFGVGMSVSFGF